MPSSSSTEESWRETTNASLWGISVSIKWINLNFEELKTKISDALGENEELKTEINKILDEYAEGLEEEKKEEKEEKEEEL